jgi:hypothetical protein
MILEIPTYHSNFMLVQQHAVNAFSARAYPVAFGKFPHALTLNSICLLRNDEI